MDRLSAMQVFIRVIEMGSFSAAARHEQIGQPAVSKAIAQLEEWMGVRLLLRSTRILVPTEAGRDFLIRAKRMVEDAEEAVVAARGDIGALSGRLRVSAAVCFARLHIVPRLPEFLAAHPELEVELVLDDRNIDLIEEGIDVALRMGSLPDSSMTARKIAQGRRLVMATPAYFERFGIPKTPTDLIGHEAVIYTRDGGGESWNFKKDSAELSVAVSGRLRVTATEGLRAAVFANIGLTISSEWSFTPELVSGEVVSIMEDWSLPPINLSAVFPAGRLIGVKARTFVDFVDLCIRSDEPYAPPKIAYKRAKNAI
jgi:DNA-binding transcriptional LysR family regulator